MDLTTYLIQSFYSSMDAPPVAVAPRVNYVRSIYAKGASAAMVGLTVKAGIVRTVMIWRSSDGDFDVIDAVRDDLEKRKGLHECSQTIINPDNLSTKESFIGRVFSDEGIYVSTTDSFEPIQGLAVLWQLERAGLMSTESCKGWNRLKTEVDRAEKSQPNSLMAFLQGLIACRGYTK